MSETKEKIRLQCVGCKSTLQVLRQSIGKTARCPKCQHLTPITSQNTARIGRSVPIASPTANKSSQKRRTSGPPKLPPQPLQSQALDYLPPLGGAIPPADPNYYAYSAPVRSRAKSGLPVWVIWLLGAMGVMVVGTVLVGIGLGIYSAARSRIANAPATNTGEIADSSGSPGGTGNSAPGSLSPLPSPSTDRSTGAKVYLVSDANSGGGTTRMRIYVPIGEHAPKSLPCVFVAPAGTTLLHGVDIGSEDNMDELTPFIQANMVVVCYSIGGPMPQIDPDDRRYMQALAKAYKEFAKSDAGVIDGQTAINRALRSIPEVDPAKLYTTGHSSAATLSLLLGAKDSRISKSLAFAPITDLNVRFDGILAEPSITSILPGIEGYLKSGSPITYANRGKAKVWVAHAMDDDNEPVQNTNRYVAAFSSNAPTLHSPNAGGHYGEFLYANIPEGIRWLQSE